jgi:elongation factor P--(R)-beta-lysine ligase
MSRHQESSRSDTGRSAINTDMAWRPTASLEALKLRANIMWRMREYFRNRGVLEVETPALSQAAAADPNLRNLTTRFTGPGAAHGLPLYLHTSPELAMKRLLAADSGSIFQICKVFRNGETGRLHNPEFTMLEWYRVGFDHHRLMEETAELVTTAFEGYLGLAPTEKLSYREAFLRYADLDPFAADATAYAACAERHGIVPSSEISYADLDVWRDLLLTHIIEPHLGNGRLTLLYDYPATHAALARIRAGSPPVAERFELYFAGVELVNGFHELTDGSEQRRRFARDSAIRKRANLPDPPLDERFLTALSEGLPACAGAALGVDRLVMLAAGCRSLTEVIAFPIHVA